MLAVQQPGTRPRRRTALGPRLGDAVAGARSGTIGGSYPLRRRRLQRCRSVRRCHEHRMAAV